MRNGFAGLPVLEKRSAYCFSISDQGMICASLTQRLSFSKVPSKGNMKSDVVKSKWTL